MFYGSLQCILLKKKAGVFRGFYAYQVLHW